MITNSTHTHTFLLSLGKRRDLSPSPPFLSTICDSSLFLTALTPLLYSIQSSFPEGYESLPLFLKMPSISSTIELYFSSNSPNPSLADPGW